MTRKTRMSLGDPPPNGPTRERLKLKTTWRDLERQLWQLSHGSLPKKQISAWVLKIEKRSRWVPSEMTFRSILEGAIAIAGGHLPHPQLVSGVANTT